MTYRLNLAQVMGLVAVAAVAFALAPSPRAIVLSLGLLVALGIAVASPAPKRWLLIGWTAVFALNLIVPLLYADVLTKKAGGQGMIVAIFPLLGLGSPVVARFRRIGLAVILGGGVVAATQLHSLPQFYAGSIGIAAARAAGQTVGTGPDIASESGGFIATMVTGGILIAAALLLGAIVRVAWVGFGRLRARRARAAESQTAC